MRLTFYDPNKNTITKISLKNFEFLPLFYLYPKDFLIKKCPSLVDMPRSVHEILKQEKWFKMLESDFFFQAVCDITAFFVWPAFGISTHLECFSGYDPMWLLAHATSLWEKAFEDMSGITPQGLAKNLKKQHQWVEQDEFEYVMLLIGLRGIDDNNLNPCIDAIKKMRCKEDYDKRGSNAKTDFYRKWYHTRARTKVVSLDQLIEGQEGNNRGDSADRALGDIVRNPTASFEDDLCSQMDIDNFSITLSSKDYRILEMRVNGNTYQEIADELEYKTHSAVIKRIRKITTQYMDYIDEQEGRREYLNS